MIAKDPNKMRYSPLRLDTKGKVKLFKRSTVLIRPKYYQSQSVENLVGLDTIERDMGEIKRYIMTYIDEHIGCVVAMYNVSLTKHSH